MRVKAGEYSYIVDEAGIGCTRPVLEKNKWSLRWRHSRWNSQELFLAHNVPWSHRSFAELFVNFGARRVFMQQLLKLRIRIVVVAEIAWWRGRWRRSCVDRHGNKQRYNG